ncbi:MAG TPA: hypothetical protein VFF52_19810 [Isosphaeraceae bacterium]|nr:hypothetical protein [Isosphaeraceae bacterium]
MKRIWRKSLLSLAVLALLVLAGGNPARACPNCKEAVSLGSGEVASLSNGYNWSVLFMLAVPFSMMGMGAFFVHRAVKRGSLPEF